jgi:tetratricopeptide (TPR) repeat protein
MARHRGRIDRRANDANGRDTGAIAGASVPYANAPGLPVRSQRFLILAVCTFLVLAVAAVFGVTVQYGFVNYDDPLYVYENPHVNGGFTGHEAAWVFTHSYASNWHPLTWLSHMLDWQLYGPWAGGHHLTNVLLHAATAVLLFLVLRWMSGRLWPSAIAAAVFAVHPLRVESVAWVAERKDVLSGLFFVLTIAAYVWYVRRSFSIGRYLVVMAAFALGLMAKPMLVTLPFVLLLLDYWPLRRFEGEAVRGKYIRLIAEKIPLVAMVVGSCAITLNAQIDAIKPMDYVSLPERIGNALVAYVAYLGQFFCPANLAVLYPHPQNSLAVWQIVGALVALAAISAAALKWRKEQPHLLVGWLWFLGMLVPVIGLVQVGEQAMADRYTYLPQIGLCIAVVWAVADFTARRAYGARACGIAAILIVAAMMASSTQQTTVWQDSVTLWSRSIACAANSATAHNNLAKALDECGRREDAADEWRKALKVDPNHSNANKNFADALVACGRLEEAIGHYEKAVQRDPAYVSAHINYANALIGLGRIDEAMVQYQAALKLDPNSEKAHYNYANALRGGGQIEEAVVHFQAALKIDPNFAKALTGLGVALGQGGHTDEAIAKLKKAVEINPDYAIAHRELGRLLQKQGKTAEAEEHLREAERLAKAAEPPQ